MEMKLKKKYTTHKPVKQNKAGSGHSGPSKLKKPGPKTYVYGSRVMLLDATTGKTRMIAGDE